MSNLVSLRVGDRDVLVTREDATALDLDMHLYGAFFVTLAKGGGRYERVPPADVKITPPNSVEDKR